MNERKQKLQQVLKRACETDNTYAIQQLIHKGANIHEDLGKKETFVHIAAMHGSVNAIRCLYDNGADVDVLIDHYSPEGYGRYALAPYTPLEYAIDYGQCDVILALHDCQVNVKEYIKSGTEDMKLHNYALHCLSSDKLSDTLHSLFLSGSDLNQKYKDGKSLVHTITISKTFKEVEKLRLLTRLLDANVDFNSTDNEGHTPLFYASEYDVINFLEQQKNK